MTNPVPPSPTTLQKYQGIGVPEESVGFILQRGGEELALSKVNDRFTVRLSPEGAVSENWASKIPAQVFRHVPQSNLEELTAEPNRLEEAMQEARKSDQVVFASHVYTTDTNPGTYFYLSDQITIQFAEEVDKATREAIISYAGLRIVRSVEGIPNTFVCEVTKEATENPVKIANRLTRYSQVLVAEPNIIIETQQHYTPRDPFYSRQWYLNHRGGSQLAPNSHIFTEKAWDYTRGNRSVIVAVADDAIDLNHPDFKGSGKVVSPLDLKDRDFSPMPTGEDNHGTACAGLAVAEENGQGIVGVAPGCALMPIRTTGFLDDESVEQIFNWAIDKNAAVVSCSWGPSAVYFPLSLRQKAVLTRAATEGRRGKGCVVVFAAGNANRPVNGTINEKGWPKNIISGQTKWLAGFTVHPDVITVSACTSLNKKAAYSNWGTGISLCAPSNNAPPGMALQETGYVNTPPEVTSYLPGLGVFTTDRLGGVGYETGDYTGYFGGTSSATPIVAGVAALVISANPDLTAQQVRNLLQQTADKIIDTDPDPQFGTRYGTYDSTGRCDWFGYGKVNALKAVQAAIALRSGGGGGTGGGKLTDISGHWAEKFIDALANANIISGFLDGTYKPNDYLTRAQYAALLTKAFNAPAKYPATNFIDVPATFWGRVAIEAANRAGFLVGYPGLQFRPYQNLTRAEAIVSLINGLGFTGGQITSLDFYSDRYQIPTYAVNAIATATEKNLIVNYPIRNRLSPLRDITRAEIAVMIYQTLVARNQMKPIDSPYLVIFSR